MLDKEKLEKLKKITVSDCVKEDLSDLKDVKIDKSLSYEKRAESFVRQVKNPYLFRIGDIKMRVVYAGCKSFFELLNELLSVG